jgi:hypothetical protein
MLFSREIDSTGKLSNSYEADVYYYGGIAKNRKGSGGNECN